MTSVSHSLRHLHLGNSVICWLTHIDNDGCRSGWGTIGTMKKSSPPPLWAMDAWCSSQEHKHLSPLSAYGPPDWDSLPASSRQFLLRLNLSSTHPHCADNFTRFHYELPGVPPQGPLVNQNHLESAWDVVVTLVLRTLPPVLAMGELWLRLLACVVAPIGVAHLATTLCTSSYHSNRSHNSSEITSSATSSSRRLIDSAKPLLSPGRRLILTLHCLLTTASALVLCTDTLYVLEYGHQYGLSLLVASILLSLSVSTRYSLRALQLVLLAGGLILTAVLASPRGIAGVLEDSEACHVSEGLYFQADNPDAKRLVDHLSPQSYRYDLPPRGSATTWMPTGDSRTGLPFMLNHLTGPRWVRLWLPVTDDDGVGEEIIALDVSFPDGEDGGHNESKPLYLVLHGLSGGSQEEYIKDFAIRRNHEGSTVVVMVARGLMDLPVRGMNLFHGARYQDVHAAATALRSALDDGDGSRQVLAGVGYSMGGIVLANYVSRLGPDAALDVAVSISGGLDMRHETNFTRAQRLWQPILTQTLRNVFVAGKWGERVRFRLSKKEMKQMLRAYHITELDNSAVVAYNGFRDLDHYYSEMSALGDTPLELHKEYDESGRASSFGAGKRMQNLSIPLLVVHALDDPLISWRTVAANQGLMRPERLVRWVLNGNLFLLLTKRGGHVGWPLGLNPTKYKWKWMNDVAMSFVEAYSNSR